MKKIKRILPILFSPRFYAVVLIATAAYLKAHGLTLTVNGFADWLMFIAGGGTAIGTIDKFSKNFGVNA
mgnify:CR=1 FL=1